MANFLTAHPKVHKNEGFYGDDQDDSGGETLWGIARKMNPQWEGWTIVDKHREEKGFPGILKNNTTLIKLKESFYKREFWNKLRGDEILDQAIATELYDSAVNIGVKPAIKMLQKTLALIQTGVMDDATIEKLNARKNG